MLGSSVLLIATDHLDNTTSTVLVGDDTGMNSSCTDERISTIHRLVRSIGSRTTYNHRRIDNFLVPNRSRVENMIALTVGPASEGKSATAEGTAFTSIETASVPSAPVCHAASDGLRHTPSFNLTRDRVPALNQSKSDDPDGEVEKYKPKAVFSFGQKALDKK